MQKLFEEYILSFNVAGSNKAGSYWRALNRLDNVLREKTNLLQDDSSIWQITDEKRLRSLYEYVKGEQKLGDKSIFVGTPYPSFWKSRFYSSAVKAFLQFVCLQNREKRMLSEIEREHSGSELAFSLSGVEIMDQDAFLPDTMNASSLKGKDIIREVKVRQNQDVFRKIILKIYHGQCCLTGIDVQPVLRASHIIPWAEREDTRMNPENGLCLSATYDAAFDRHLISFDENNRMVLSPSLKEHCTNAAFKRYFSSLEGCQIRLPCRYFPSQKFLQEHRVHMV